MLRKALEYLTNIQGICSICDVLESNKSSTDTLLKTRVLSVHLSANLLHQLTYISEALSTLKGFHKPMKTGKSQTLKTRWKGRQSIDAYM